jgi:hypothetical protein
MRILYHAINGSGLGHLMRASTIADAVRRFDGEIHQLIVTNSAHTEPVRILGLPVLALPEHEGSPYTGIDRRLHVLPRATLEAVLRDVIADYDAGTVVFDTHFPAGVVQVAAADGRALVLVLRRTRAKYLEHLLERGMLRLFERIVIPHEPEHFRTLLPPGLVTGLENHPGLSYAGPIVRPADPASGTALKARLGISDDARLVVITCGAGGYRDSQRLLRDAVLATQLMPRRLQVVVIGGPYGIRPELPLGCLFLPAEPELPTLLASADLVIGHAGYNTVHEVAQAGAPAVFVAMPRWNEDQAANVASFVREGRAACVPLGTPPERIAELGCVMLDRPRPKPVDFPGRRRAAEIVASTRRPAIRQVVGDHLAAPEWWARVPMPVEDGTVDLDRRLGQTVESRSQYRNVLIGFAEFVRHRLGDRSDVATRWFVDIGEASPGELVRRAVAAVAGPTQADVVLVATVAENPTELVDAAAGLAVRGLVLRIAPEFLSAPEPWVAGTLEYGRRTCPRLVLDITSTTRPLLAIDDDWSAAAQLRDSADQSEPTGGSFSPGDRQLGKAAEHSAESAVLDG